MGELILHIGIPKTGTTSLQRFFSDNREVLARNGVDYLQFTPQQKEAFAKWRNGCFLSRYCRALASREPISNRVSDFEENYKRLADALKGDRRILLSDENFTTFSAMAYEGRTDPEKYWRELSYIVNELGVTNTTLILYLRRQDKYVVSQWKEAVKNGHTRNNSKDYLNQPHISCRLDYASMLDAIKDSFIGPANVIVRSYDQVVSSNNNLYHDFCKSLGIAWDSDFRIPMGKNNESISFDMTEALRTCKYGGIGRSIEEKRVRNRLAVALCRKHPDPNGTTVFSPEEAAALMEQYRAENCRIEEEYYDNKRLFSDEYREGTVWHPNKLRIAKYRFAFLCPELSLKLCSGSRRIRHIINKVFDCNNI